MLCWESFSQDLFLFTALISLGSGNFIALTISLRMGLKTACHSILLSRSAYSTIFSFYWFQEVSVETLLEVTGLSPVLLHHALKPLIKENGILTQRESKWGGIFCKRVRILSFWKINSSKLGGNLDFGLLPWSTWFTSFSYETRELSG